MGGGTTEIHNDDDYIATGTHKGPDGVDYLYDPKADFLSCDISEDAHIENDTQAEYGAVVTVTEKMITTDNDVYVATDGTYYTTDGTPYSLAGASGITWYTGDTYYIYKTRTKGSFISSIWTDLSRGWKTDPKEMRLGWRNDDIDLDKNGEKIFGPGQPE
jgi:hypothetical protein